MNAVMWVLSGLLAILILPAVIMMVVSIIDWWIDAFRIAIGKEPRTKYPNHYAE